MFCLVGKSEGSCISTSGRPRLSLLKVTRHAQLYLQYNSIAETLNKAKPKIYDYHRSSIEEKSAATDKQTLPLRFSTAERLQMEVKTRDVAAWHPPRASQLSDFRMCSAVSSLHLLPRPSPSAQTFMESLSSFGCLLHHTCMSSLWTLMLPFIRLDYSVWNRYVKQQAPEKVIHSSGDALQGITRSRSSEHDPPHTQNK